MNQRSHPVRVLLDSSAAGRPPASQEVTALVSSVCEGMNDAARAAWRRRFETACRAAALTYDGGEMGNARRHARAAAAELADSLEAAGAEPWTPSGLDVPDDPAAIAAAIPRF